MKKIFLILFCSILLIATATASPTIDVSPSSAQAAQGGSAAYSVKVTADADASYWVDASWTYGGYSSSNAVYLKKGQSYTWNIALGIGSNVPVNSYTVTFKVSNKYNAYATLKVTSTPCSDECSSWQKQCNGNGYQICGNYDSDSCLEWSPVNYCNSGQMCSNGNCISSQVDVSLQQIYILDLNNEIVVSNSGVQYKNINAGDTLNFFAEVYNNGISGNYNVNYVIYGPNNACRKEYTDSWHVNPGDDYYSWHPIKIDSNCPAGRYTYIATVSPSTGKKTLQISFDVTSSTLSCQDKCSSGQKQCNGNGYQTCSDYNNDGCLEWSSTISCSSNQICKDGNCIAQNIACSKDNDCGTDGWIGSSYCSADGSNNLWQKYRGYKCNNPNTASAYCSYNDIEALKEDCSDICCSGECTDSKTDINNCGSCSHKCSDGQYCIEGLCTKCGNEKCDGDETITSCPRDCDRNYEAKFWNCVYTKGIPERISKQPDRVIRIIKIVNPTLLSPSYPGTIQLSPPEGVNPSLKFLRNEGSTTKIAFETTRDITTIYTCFTAIGAGSACAACAATCPVTGVSCACAVGACDSTLVLGGVCLAGTASILSTEWTAIDDMCRNVPLPTCGDGFCDDRENETCSKDCPTFEYETRICDDPNDPETAWRGITSCNTFSYNISEITGKVTGKWDYGETATFDIKDLPAVKYESNSLGVLSSDGNAESLAIFTTNQENFTTITDAGKPNCSNLNNSFNTIDQNTFKETAAAFLMCNHMLKAPANEKCLLPRGCKILANEGPANSLACTDGFDNDEDGLLDYADPGCR